MQRPCDLHDSWGCSPFADGIFWLQLYLQGQWNWWTCHSGITCRLWWPYTRGHCECASGPRPMAPTAVSFLSSWGICRLQCLQGCDFDPVGWWAVILLHCMFAHAAAMGQKEQDQAIHQGHQQSLPRQDLSVESSAIELFGPKSTREELIYFIVHPSYFFPGWLGAKKLNGRWLHT